MAVPLEPPWNVLGEGLPERNCYLSRWRWDGPLGLLAPSAFQSAARAGALVSRSLGPRGGLHWAVASREAWREWAARYRARCEVREAREAARRLGFDGNTQRIKRRGHA